MRSRNAWAPVAVAGMLAAAGWAFARVYLYSAESGEIFPELSSLRADPLGSRALHDAIESMPGFRARRWFRPLKEFQDPSVALLFLGESRLRWRFAPDKMLEEYEEIAQRGARIVIALRAEREPREKPPEPKKSIQPAPPAKPPEIPPIETRWKLRLAKGLEPLDPAWTVHLTEGETPVAIERKFDKGSIAILAGSRPFSNEYLRDDRDTGLLQWAFGGHRDIVFDEFHLGTEQSGSIGTLVRRFHLEPAAAVLLVLAALFVWRAGASFLPPAETETVDAITGRDSAAGLASLLRRGIPPAALPATALELWRKSAPLLPSIPARAKSAIEVELSQPVAPARLLDLWRQLHQLTKKRT